MSDFNDSVEGLDNAEAILRDWKIERSGAIALASLKNRLPGVVVEKIRQKKRLTAHEVPFLKQHSPGDIKMTLPTPNQFPAIAYKKGLSDQAYAQLLGIPVGHRAHLQGRDSGLWRARASATSRSTRRATATTSIPSGGATCRTRWASIRSRRWTKRSAWTTRALKAPAAMAAARGP